MDVTATKVGIIFGLLATTLTAALLPYFCFRYSARKARSGRTKSKGICGSALCCSKATENLESASSNGVVRSNSNHQIRQRNKLLMSVLNCFSGGIFLATSFLGLLPEIRESFETFSVTWPTRSTSPANNGTSLSAEEATQMPIAEIVITCGLFLILIIEQSAHAWHHTRVKKKQNRGSFGSETVKFKVSADQATMDVAEEEQEHEHKHGEEHDHSGIRSLLLVATLSIHSFLEGIAMGLQDTVGSLLAIFFAVLFHKSLMALSMGTNLVQGGQPFKRILAAGLVFAFMSPGGISVGLIIKVAGGNGSGTLLVNAILQAIATGTFLYITFFEVLVREFEGHGNRFWKVVALLLGYGAILGAFFAQHA
uniref:zinc transporter ZIP1 n=1 Tax=Ciona intestinalis TaxID=7719 RepID=UPI00005219AB|nr:zinc transporter ZIP1 [Ciona intestinalis]XP_002124508.1 zinc transporter ZIP1 [Ciona intestinalis]XP_026692398.1 zinc transporter ZIP1 [Ciona intestinalis]|eukprot:XP_002124433.1 zinc transporter ZIP1 [Ciona intestinalis]